MDCCMTAQLYTRVTSSSHSMLLPAYIPLWQSIVRILLIGACLHKINYTKMYCSDKSDPLMAASSQASAAICIACLLCNACTNNCGSWLVRIRYVTCILYISKFHTCVQITHYNYTHSPTAYKILRLHLTSQGKSCTLNPPSPLWLTVIGKLASL